MATFKTRLSKISKSNGKVILANDYNSSEKNLQNKTIQNIKKLNPYLCGIKLNFHLLLPLSAKDIIKINKTAHDYGLQTIADIKLNDIGNTNRVTTEHLWNLGFDDVPFPLFLFPYKDKWLLGVFMNFNDEGTSYFCHIVLNDDPANPFIKFSTTNGIEPTFVQNPSEHGYSYIKIIKLKDTHPLVDYGHLQN